MDEHTDCVYALAQLEVAFWIAFGHGYQSLPSPLMAIFLQLDVNHHAENVDFGSEM